MPAIRSRLASAAALAALALAPGVAGAADCTAAGCVPAPYLFNTGRIFGGFSNGDYRPGQTFTPKRRGVLEEVRLGLHNAGAPSDPTPVTAEIRTVAGGFPTREILAQAPVAGAPYVGGNLYTASFAAHNLVLESGTRYAVTLRAGGPQIVYILAVFPGCGPASGSNDPVHTYDGGQTWGYAWSPGERSFVYEVCLGAITPATSATWGRLKTLYR